MRRRAFYSLYVSSCCAGSKNGAENLEGTLFLVEYNISLNTNSRIKQGQEIHQTPECTADPAYASPSSLFWHSLCLQIREGVLHPRAGQVGQKELPSWLPFLDAIYGISQERYCEFLPRAVFPHAPISVHKKHAVVMGRNPTRPRTPTGVFFRIHGVFLNSMVYFAGKG